jgi:hypothetical protein
MAEPPYVRGNVESSGWVNHPNEFFDYQTLFKEILLRALATDSLKESVSLHLGKKREKTTKTSHSRSPTFNLFHWVSTVFPMHRETL